MSKSKGRSKTSRDVLVAEANTLYTLETLEKITHISRDRIVIYYEYGLVSPVKVVNRKRLIFDEEAVHKLRRIAFLLSEYEINQNGLRKLFSLMDELERLREEVRFLRER